MILNNTCLGRIKMGQFLSSSISDEDKQLLIKERNNIVNFVNSLELKINTLSNKLDDKDNVITSFKDTLKNQDEQINALQNTNKSKDEQIESFKDKHDEYEKLFQSLQEQNKDLKEQISKMNERINSLNALAKNFCSLQHVEIELNLVKSKNAEIIESFKGLTSRLNAVEDVHQVLDARIDRYKDFLDTLIEIKDKKPRKTKTKADTLLK